MDYPKGHFRNPIDEQLDALDYDKFVRKPFTVDAIEVTVENIAELAEFIGTLQYKENGAPYIRVNRRLVPNIFHVYPGFWMTRMGDNIRCYSKKIFEEQFVRSTDDIENWVNFLNNQGVKVFANSGGDVDATGKE